MTLEHLEGRIVLNGDVTVTFGPPALPAGELFIQGDTANDNFVVTETANGMVTVAPGATKIIPNVGVITPSTINTTSTPVTFGPVSTIVMSLPGTTNFDLVTLNGPGKTTPTTVGSVSVSATGANLTFTGNAVDNSGNLVISDTYSLPPGGMDANLAVSVSNSSFAGISITQTGCCPAVVTLTNDTAPGTVLVSEGNADPVNNVHDAITLSGDAFGPTTLLQHNGGPSTYHGNLDSISVTNSSVVNLKAEQNVLNPMDGYGNTININGLTVSPASFGVITSQGNGSPLPAPNKPNFPPDVTTVNAVTISAPLNPNMPLPGPSSVPSISVTQGSGNGDQATVSNSTLPGNITIHQADVSGNTLSDTATVSNDVMGFVQLFNGMPYQGFYGNITVTQGNADGDSANVVGSTAVGNISITQGNGKGDAATISGGGPDGVVETGQPTPGQSYGGNLSITQGSGNGDTATIAGTATTPLVTAGNVYITQNDVSGNTSGDRATVAYVTAGFTLPTSPGNPYTFDYNGNVYISQGDAYNDEAVLLGSIGTNGAYNNTVNNVYISQGDNTFVPGCTLGLSDIAQINGYNITSNIDINQGDGDGDEAGNYVTAIGFDYIGLITNGATSSLSVQDGGDAAITQDGYNNMVFLGDPGTYGGPAASFQTNYLDVFTGLGGAFVQAANTTVYFGSLLGLYTIDGNGVNTYLDLGGNTGVTIDPNTFNYTT